jgi:DNA-binding MarR family transcriptional regulator
MGSGSGAAQGGTDLAPETLAALQAATRVLAGVALRSLDVLDGAVTLPQFRMLAVLADLGRARSVQVARALGLEASTVTRLADRMVAAGYVSRGGEPRHRGVVTLELTGSGKDLVGRVAAWRGQELGADLPPAPACRAGAGHPRAVPARSGRRRGLRDDFSRPGAGVTDLGGRAH